MDGYEVNCRLLVFGVIRLAERIAMTPAYVLICALRTDVVHGIFSFVHDSTKNLDIL